MTVIAYLVARLDYIAETLEDQQRPADAATVREARETITYMIEENHKIVDIACAANEKLRAAEARVAYLESAEEDYLTKPERISALVGKASGESTEEAVERKLRAAEARVQEAEARVQELEGAYAGAAEFAKVLELTDSPVRPRERALAFLRVWANSYLLKGSQWDVPHTMGATLNQAIRLLESEQAATDEALAKLEQEMRAYTWYGELAHLPMQWADTLKALRTVESRASGPCPHDARILYEPESSVADESDYLSQCQRCGVILRDAPNVTGRALRTGHGSGSR